MFRSDLQSTERTCSIKTFWKRRCKKVLKQIHKWQDYFRGNYGTTFVHASDEWFILAGQEFPDEAYYEGYGQLENGVGMMRLLLEEVKERLEELSGDDRRRQYPLQQQSLLSQPLRNLREMWRKSFHI